MADSGKPKDEAERERFALLAAFVDQASDAFSLLDRNLRSAC